ncbi:HD domain-containing phosphohydrolase [uncultured Desulfobacter sp.]|uniref:HD-GYP domain-containing protein n=1 Tax=uncultured Desulfobacter sp. TaxID=240139 RepID=UPI0029F4B30C|nr:HD domain-containing phosphohydrolase [uncultured Desulfobacter sp.]
MYKLIICALIFSGILFMFLSIKKFRDNTSLMKEFYIDDSLIKPRAFTFHRSLLFLFLIGYILTLGFYIFDIHFASDLVTAFIFFFGAVFVFIENNLHKNIVSSIKRNYDKTIQISSALEEEREKLLSLNRKLTQTEDVTIFALAYQAELRDTITGNHIARTAKYVELLTQKLMEDSKYKDYVTPEYKVEIVKSAPLHDIGKVAIPDKILQKEGAYTDDEFDIMKRHCEFGADIIKRAMQKLNFRSFLQIAEQLALSHHEKWDGSGYPMGMSGDDIPLSGRIMAVADVYDALRTKRQYKDAFTHDQSCRIIIKDSGTHFDPEVVSAFKKLSDQFEKISIDFGDGA